MGYYMGEGRVKDLLEKHFEEFQGQVAGASWDLTGYGDTRSDDYGDVFDSYDEKVWDEFVNQITKDQDSLFGELDEGEIDSDDLDLSWYAEEAVKIVAEQVRWRR